MVRAALDFALRKLGRRYPAAIVVAQFQTAHLVVLGGLSLLLLYTDLSSAEFLRIVAVAQALIFIENLFATRLVLRLLRPVVAWLGGQRDDDSTVHAWLGAAQLPASFLKRFSWKPLFFNLLPVVVFTAWELELDVVSTLAILAGGLVVTLYGWTLRYFAMELAMRPLLEQISPQLPDRLVIGRPGVPLRLKLLAVLPAINVITGVLVSGLSGSGNDLGDLGVDVLIAVAVAFTVSLELTLLLSSSILRPIHDFEEAIERIRSGDLKARVPVVSTDETGSLAQSFNEMAVRLEERERLREALGSFVDPALAETVLRDGALDGQEVEVSVLFVDIRGFTAFAEQASAREVVAKLNDFYERVVPVLLRHGGHANKFIGDGLLGVFGAPDHHPDHADRAVAASLEIAAHVRECYGEDLRIGIGVNSGPVLAGTIGGGGRLDFTVIGDPVNTASRVEAATRETGDDVLITEATRCLLTREFGTFEERPVAELRGKSEAVRLYAPVPAAGGVALRSRRGSPITVAAESRGA